MNAAGQVLADVTFGVLFVMGVYVAGSMLVEGVRKIFARGEDEPRT